ncbi:hypothetical protein [Paenibacillus ginsengarvi]|uniref:Tissue inhibitor of metalloproteinase n=1 Tax=Paenibacillus ginsengarvi TaxID=400777 RepID=A0A3B0CGT8_9BACL|nr:hypothetical protein [Paenibacillus ginsengarvi]RKN83934.1 hypothetical protein D7M11_15240 [Paenibacillus ginsengarvi]
MFKRIWLALLVSIGCFVGVSSQANASSCAPPQPVKQELESSSIVFKGKATEVKKGGLTVFQVEEAWKGVKSTVVELYDNGWDPYTPGNEYLVFGGERDGGLRTNLCGRSGLWDQAREDAMKKENLQSTVFSPGSAPVIAKSVERTGTQSMGVVVAGAVIVLLALAAVSIVLWRNMRRGAD